MIDLAETRRELRALQAGLKRRLREVSGRAFLAPDLRPMQERIAYLERALQAAQRVRPAQAGGRDPARARARG